MSSRQRNNNNLLAHVSQSRNATVGAIAVCSLTLFREGNGSSKDNVPIKKPHIEFLRWQSSTNCRCRTELLPTPDAATYIDGTEWALLFPPLPARRQLFRLLRTGKRNLHGAGFASQCPTGNKGFLNVLSQRG